MARITKVKLSEQVVDEIRRRIETGQLKIGEKLPNQNELSLELGVSRTSLREGMRMLDLLGVIEQRPGYGTVIRSQIPESYKQNSDLTLLSDAESTFELLEARMVIECGSVALAAEKATDAQIESLFALVEEMAKHLSDGNYDRYRTCDYAFHTLISKATGNRFLIKSVSEISNYVQQFIDENTMLLPGLLKQSQRSHQGICEAIATRDPKKAKKAMRQHIQTIVNSYKRYRSSKENKE